MTNDELVSVLTLNDPIKAELVKVVLQDHDLFCAIEGEQQAGLTGIFPIRILVRSGDSQNAAEIISKNHLDD